MFYWEQKPAHRELSRITAMKKKPEEQKKSLLATVKKKTKSRQQLQKEIIAFLNAASTAMGSSPKPGCPLRHGLASVLATVHESIPRATPVDFFNDGLTIWIAGEPGLKIRNIRSNPAVAMGIYHPMDHSKHNRSLQILGTARLINYTSQRAAFMRRLKKMGLYAALQKILTERLRVQNLPLKNLDAAIVDAARRFNLIRIDPEEITFLSIHPTRGTEKDVWKKAGKKSNP
jgi:nitroimidazol reductase NimA-like FMN-containing flavoprotein (pyridoxamine 5'-phosphate oxidase superfamily)